MPVSESTFKANSINIMEPGHSSVDSGYLIDKEKSTRYWEDANADDDGMLGGVSSVAGFSSTSKIDLQGSRGFLAKLGVGRASNRRTVDCALEGGAGCVCVVTSLRDLCTELLSHDSVDTESVE